MVPVMVLIVMVFSVGSDSGSDNGSNSDAVHGSVVLSASSSSLCQ